MGVEDKSNVSADAGKQIVEVMRDSAGEASDRLHFRGLAQLLFQHPPGRDILNHDEDCRGPPLFLDLIVFTLNATNASNVDVKMLLWMIAGHVPDCAHFLVAASLCDYPHALDERRLLQQGLKQKRH
jgi:hypothetical protein